MNYIGVAALLLTIVPIALADSMVGGYSAAQEPTAAVESLFSTFKSKTLEVLDVDADNCDPTVLSFRTQVVAGTNYKIKVDLCSDGVAIVKIFKPLPYTGLGPQFVSAAFTNDN